MTSTLSRMHEDNPLGRIEPEPASEAPPQGSLSDDARLDSAEDVLPEVVGDETLSNQPLLTEDSIDPWIDAAGKEAASRSSRSFIDKKSRYNYPPNAATGGGTHAEHTDEALFLRWQQGDNAAFLAIYERYKSNIYAYCARVIMSVGLPREVVDDTFQDVFMRLTQFRDTFTGGAFDKWIFTVTRHSCMSAKKKAFRRNSWMENIGDGENFDDTTSNEVRAAFSFSDDPLDRLTAEEQTDLLMKAIAKLPDVFREALMMSEYEGLTYEEIGKITGTSLSTIRIRIFRAKARLRKMLLPIIGDEAGQLFEGPNPEH